MGEDRGDAIEVYGDLVEARHREFPRRCRGEMFQPLTFPELTVSGAPTLALRGGV
jgi:hypothetical protein